MLLMSHIASCHITNFFIAHARMRGATHMNDLRHAYEGVKRHIKMRRVTRVHESCHTYE